MPLFIHITLGEACNKLRVVPSSRFGAGVRQSMRRRGFR